MEEVISIGLKVLGIFDGDIQYAASFAEYISEQRSIPFQVRVFTNMKALEEFCVNHKIEILLLSSETVYEEIDRLAIDKIIVLSEGEILTEHFDYPIVYKYQSCDDIISEIMVNYNADYLETSNYNFNGLNLNIVGVYSPIQRCGRTSFALTLANVLGRNSQTLYLNFEMFSGLEKRIDSQDHRDLGDLMYYYMQDPESLAANLNMAALQISNMDYIAPMRYGGDLKEVDSKEWVRLIGAIGGLGQYENIVLDLGEGIGDILEILNLCNKIYMPTLSDNISKFKLEEFQEFLFKAEFVSILDKIYYLEIISEGYSCEDCGYLEELFWGAMSKFVDRIIVGEVRGKEALDMLQAMLSGHDGYTR